jgi:trk system potassium uptake protein
MLRNFIRPIDFKIVCISLAKLLGLLGFMFIFPLLVSLIYQEFAYSLIFFALLIALLIVGFIGRRLYEEYRRGPVLKDALIVTALIYLFYSLIGGLIFTQETSYINGVFETMSGFTTTGLTMVNPEILPRTLVFFRSYTQWLGGLGIIIISLALLFGPGGAPFKLYASEFGEENIVGSVVSTARIVIKIYLLLTLCGYISLLVAGAGYFDGLVHILSGISTGGFSAYNDNISHYGSVPIYLTLLVFMFLGAVSFPVYYKVARRGTGEFFKDIQVKVLFVIVVFSSVLFFINFEANLKSLTDVVFQAVTSITQTGFNTVDISSLSDKSKFLTIVSMVIGGGTASTTGGIKILRFLVLIGALRWLVLKRALPEEAKISLKVGGIEISPNSLSIVMGFVTSYIALLLLSTFIIMHAENYSFVDSLFETASAQGTVGLSVGITNPDMNILSKILYIFNMWVGRLEILPVLILLSPTTWIKKAKRPVKR